MSFDWSASHWMSKIPQYSVLGSSVIERCNTELIRYQVQILKVTTLHQNDIIIFLDVVL